MSEVPTGGPARFLATEPFASRGDLGLDRRRVTQCALSRICGVCGESLGRPIAFIGSAEECAANGFHFPPAHVGCAEAAVVTWRGRSVLLGHPRPPREWRLVTTSGFEYVRPSADWSDRRAVFAPNSVIEERALTP
ncbi:MAG TPA: hypothetical protein VFR99_00425 [Marmoricola sp.]|nr:hypothetical protein [Marmoricola sp.]